MSEAGPPRFIARYRAGTVDGEPDGRLRSPSFDRNCEPIRDRLVALLAGRDGTVLEIGAGTGQHAAHLAHDLPGLVWLPSDPDPDHRVSIAAWAAALPGGMPGPLDLDATADWAADPALASCLPLTAVYAQNVTHIAPWAVTVGILSGAARALGPEGMLILYGPFDEGGRHTGPGNARFHAALAAQDPAWGLRDVDAIDDAAAAHGFAPAERIAMPSDNRLLVYRRG